VRSHAEHDGGQRAVTELAHDGGTTTLVSSWRAGDSSKQTSVAFPGGVEVRLDHTAMTGLLLAEGRVVEHLGYTGAVGRKAAHYRGLYADVLSSAPSRLSSLELAAEITGLLDAATARASVAGSALLTWESATAVDC
jgi:hypothetical protein